METFSMDAATLTIQIINLLGLCGLGWLIYTLKNAVGAQKTTIEAQEAHIKSMASIVNMLDAPAMAARFEAHRKIVDEEKTAWMKNEQQKVNEVARQVTKQIEELTLKLQPLHQDVTGLGTMDTLEERIRATRDDLAKFRRDLEVAAQEQAALYFAAVSTLAVNFKSHPVDWEVQRNSLPAALRREIEQLMVKLAATAQFRPDLKIEVTPNQK
jgi:hypothetical protein